MKENNLPEEKLLKLIRGKKNFFPANGKESGNSAPNLSFSSIRRILSITLALSCVYLLISFIYPVIFPRKVRIPDILRGKSTKIEADFNVEVMPYEFYLKGISNRQVFKNSAVMAGNPGTSLPLSDVNAIDAVKDINLIGIVQKDNPQAIIEDKKTQKTYYVTKGQFAGEFQVEDIEAEKVILNYKGQRLELYL
ncbi:MAG: hypothetical protein V1919_00215 [Candidatus Omnitrophota bacterium]